MHADPLEIAAGLVAGADNIVAFTGAGISAESGVPTFRGAGGLWRRHDPISLATPEAFRRDPRGVWAWYAWRRSMVARCAPNDGHRALVDLEASGRLTALITQNVDGLHRAAGSSDVLHLHGDLFIDRCSACEFSRDTRASWPVESAVAPDDPDRDPESPRCPSCGALLRPGVVWFGESLPGDVFERAAAAAEACDLLLVVGTSAVVYPAASLVPIARRGGAAVVVVNPEPTDHSAIADVHVAAGAASALPQLVGAQRVDAGRRA